MGTCEILCEERAADRAGPIRTPASRLERPVPSTHHSISASSYVYLIKKKTLESDAAATQFLAMYIYMHTAHVLSESMLIT